MHPAPIRHPTEPAPSTERSFYSATRAFGRFGIRIFEPQLMDAPHWHGHIEINFLQGAGMVYGIDGAEVHIPEGRLVFFWAGVPHQLLRLEQVGPVAPVLGNVYLPLDAFLLMPHIAKLHVALLSGAIIALPADLCNLEVIARWYGDYRSGKFERAEMVKMEINAVLRRAQIGVIDFLRAPGAEVGAAGAITSVHIRHVVAMVRHVMENLGEPLRNADVASVTGLHENYALALFTRVMRLPVKQFVIRMRLLRARALLTESSLAIASIAEATGFQSISQFYHHFRQAYGVAPNGLRKSYLQAELR